MRKTKPRRCFCELIAGPHDHTPLCDAYMEALDTLRREAAADDWHRALRAAREQETQEPKQ